MFILISVGFGLVFFTAFSKTIKRHSVGFYVFFVALAIAVVVLSNRKVLFSLPDFVRLYIFPFFMNATIATSVFIIVMYLGVLPKNLKLTKLLMPVRGELSIIASILTLAHNIVYGKTYFVALFKKPLFPLPLNFTMASIVSLFMIIIMFPLFVTSFKTIRKKMKPKIWKNLQRWAYLFYALIWVHIFLIYFPAFKKGNVNHLFSLAVYTIIFALYFILRIKIKYLSKNRTN